MIWTYDRENTSALWRGDKIRATQKRRKRRSTLVSFGQLSVGCDAELDGKSAPFPRRPFTHQARYWKRSRTRPTRCQRKGKCSIDPGTPTAHHPCPNPCNATPCGAIGAAFALDFADSRNFPEPYARCRARRYCPKHAWSLNRQAGYQTEFLTRRQSLTSKPQNQPSECFSYHRRKALKIRTATVTQHSCGKEKKQTRVVFATPWRIFRKTIQGPLENSIWKDVMACGMAK